MSLNRYYQDELLALRDLGKEFSARNPALAPFFDTPGRDPDVERILEGFAFLTGRLREKLDDELPEITHALFSLLWPNYLRPVPACSVVRCETAPGTTGPVVVPRGTLLDSVEIDGTKCRFRTAYAVEALPLRLVEQHFMEKDGQAGVTLRFSTVGAALEDLGLTSLRFFLAGDSVLTHTLYYTLTRRVKEIRVLLHGNGKMTETVATLSPAAIRPVGFADEEGLYPYPANSFPGYRILQEYFCFPEKFLFVEVKELDKGLTQSAFAALPGATEFSLHCVLHELPDRFESFRTDNWQLFCTPVVNLFPMDSSPLTVDGRQSEYRIVPDPRRPDHYAVYSVNAVSAWGHEDRQRRRYTPFESFDHETDKAETQGYYRLRIRPSLRDKSTEISIAILRTAGSRSAPQSETLSLDLTCTNRDLPRALAVGDIRLHTDSTPDAIMFNNITPVIPSFAPPLEGDLLWRLLSNMSLNYLSLSDISALRALLACYDFRARHDKPRAKTLENILNGMTELASEETDRMYAGLPVRGSRTTLTVDGDAFSCVGDMYLFGSVLSEFLSLYATVNSFHQLGIVEHNSGEEYQWPVRLGRTTIA